MKRLGYRAFTLAELLTAVLVISIIMVALAPVITKRVQDKIDVEMVNKKGEQVYSNPGDYVFEVPVGINTLFIQGSGGSGGGGGASVVEHTDNYNKTNISSSTYNWTVPKGVNQIELTITGSGGGGGAGYIKDESATVPSYIQDKADTTLYNNKCLSDEFLAIRGDDDENDLCITNKNINPKNAISKMNGNESHYFKEMARGAPQTDIAYCQSNPYCYWPNGMGTHISGTSCTNKHGYSACGRPLSTLNVARLGVCDVYHANSIFNVGYRLLKTSEAQKIVKYGNEWAVNGLRLCYGQYSTPYGYDFDVCRTYDSGGDCPGTVNGNNYCNTSMIALQDGVLNINSITGLSEDQSWFQFTNPDQTSFKEAISIRCARPLIRSTNYNGGGGASGAQLKRTINVLPGDILTLTIGEGGTGGKLGTNSGNGSQGGITQVVHKRNSTTMGTYYVTGAQGGKGATSSAHGSTSSTASTCYAQYRSSISASLTGGTTTCSKYSSSGARGVDESGGQGAASPTNPLYRAKGGINFIDDSRDANVRSTSAENVCAKGESANPYTIYSSSLYCEARDNAFLDAIETKAYGGGGGGGYVPNWGAGYSTTQRKSYFSGGDGGSGNIELKYKVILPGAGGGPGARVAGLSASTDSNGDTVSYEIKYKVEEGDKIFLTVGAGGMGGSENQNGGDGSASYVDGTLGLISFFAGEGGKSVSYDDRIYLEDCLNTRSNGSGGSIAPSTLINTTCYRSPSYGRAAVIDHNNSLFTTNTLGVILPSNAYVLSVSAPSGGFKGTNGKVSPQGTKTTAAPWNYRLDGGMGGTGFSGLYSSQTQAGIACGGGISASYGPTVTSGSLYNYSIYCLSGSADGTSGRKYSGDENIPNSGGGGGGAVENSTIRGKGGDGSGGYIKIRWDESKNHNW